MLGSSQNNDSTGSSGQRRGRVLPGVEGAVHDNLRTFPAHLETKEGSFDAKREEIQRTTCNFARVKVGGGKGGTDFVVEQHHVDFSPPIDSKNLRIQIITTHANLLGVVYPVFNGQMLFLPHMLEPIEFTAEHPSSPEIKIFVKIRHTAHLTSDDPQTMTVVNTINRKALAMANYQQFGRHYFDPARAANVPSLRLEIWPGVISAIRPYDAGLLMCVDIAHKVIRQETAYELMLAAWKTHNCQGAWNHAAINAITHELVGKTVLTVYNNKTRRIDDIEFDMNPTAKFLRTDGTEITIAAYLAENYPKHVTEMDLHQPLLVSHAKKVGPQRHDTEAADTSVVRLVPQFCRLTGLTDDMRAKRHNMQELAVYQRMTPQQRADGAIAHLMALNAPGSPAHQLFSSWNLEVATELLTIQARRFKNERLVGGAHKTFTYRDDAEWSREVKSLKVVDGRALKNWVIVCGAGDDQQLAATMARMFKQLGVKLGIQVEAPTYEMVRDPTRASEMVAATERAMNKSTTKPSLFVYVLCDDTKARYDALKKLVCCNYFVPSQMVLRRTLKREKILDSILSKVLMQIICKLGGSLWQIQNPFYNEKTKKHVMVVGYDSYSDSSERGKAVGAAVFSMDPEISKFYSTYRTYGGTVSEKDNLLTFFQQGLEEYFTRNKCLPERIILYRDGVGEGQIPVVFNYEVKQTLTAIKKVAESCGCPIPMLTFIIVNKSINHRFYRQTGPRTWVNPQPGTVVDKACTRQERYDFYMVPQAVNQGTVTPVAFNVVWDDNKLKPHQLQWFTYKLTHMYFNWQGTIRVPAPCQYAHKLAFLVSQSLHDPTSEEMNKSMFYL